MEQSFMKCPTHLKEFIEPIGDLESILPGPTHSLFVGYRIKCKCGCSEFSVKKNDRPLVIASCVDCSQKIVLYDTDQYPDATSYNKEGSLKPVFSPRGEISYLICVGFEYPESNDEEYTDNDISWCYIYGCPHGNSDISFTIINDETM